MRHLRAFVFPGHDVGCTVIYEGYWTSARRDRKKSHPIPIFSHAETKVQAVKLPRIQNEKARPYHSVSSAEFALSALPKKTGR